jgi:hypothetical protein
MNLDKEPEYVELKRQHLERQLEKKEWTFGALPDAFSRLYMVDGRFTTAADEEEKRRKAEAPPVYDVRPPYDYHLEVSDTTLLKTCVALKAYRSAPIAARHVSLTLAGHSLSSILSPFSRLSSTFRISPLGGGVRARSDTVRPRRRKPETRSCFCSASSI